MNSNAKEPTETRSRLTPLSIIAMFLSLSEAVGGFAATQTEGGLQIALGSFVILFPIGIAVAFFYILWDRPYVLYPPREYGGKTDVAKYVDAMRQRSSKEAALLDGLDKRIEHVLTSPESLLALGKLGSARKPDAASEGADPGKTYRDIAARAAQAIRDDFIILEAGAEFGSREGRYSVVCKPTDPVWMVGVEIYFLLDSEIKPFTLGTEWALVDAQTGQRMTGMESAWSRGEVGQVDTRNVEKVGVRSGMTLRAVLLGDTKGRNAC